MPADAQTTRLVVGLDPSRPVRFDYDAVEDKKRRQPPRIRLLSEDKHLPPSDRKKLVATSRDVVRNWALAAFALRRHLDFVSTFTFLARTGNQSVDQQVQEFVSWWSRPTNFDVAGRHGMGRFVRMAEARRTLDGDFFFHKLSSGLVQAIEGDRIRTPNTVPRGVDPDRLMQGVVTSPAGRARGYCLHNRGKISDGFDFDRVVPARYMLQHGYWDVGRFDQVRGISLYASTLNNHQDLGEVLTYATAKAKLSQMFGVKWKLHEEEEESAGDVTTETDSEGNLDKSKTKIDFGRAPFDIELNSDGEDLEIVESNQPPAQLLEFAKLLIMIGLKGVDIPYCFFDEKHANYTSSRQAWQVYNESAEVKRDENREILNRLLAWRIMLAILDDELLLPKSFSLDDLRWEFVARAIPWINKLQEVNAEIAAIEAKLTSRQRVHKQHGSDFFEIADELAAEADYLAERGLGDPAEEPKLTEKATRRRAQRWSRHIARYKEYINAAA